MSVTKSAREARRQLGQWMTPSFLAGQLVDQLHLTPTTRVLEPGFGRGSFLMALIEAFMQLYSGSVSCRLQRVLQRNVFGIEVDPELYSHALSAIVARWGRLPEHHGLLLGDFLTHDFARQRFDAIVGNPPFGGTIDPKWQDVLDSRYGFKDGMKIKKETYAFFVVRSADLLEDGGRLLFICSDTFLTINTMRGLRHFLMSIGTPHVRQLANFSDETTHPVVILDLAKTGRADRITVDGRTVSRETINLTPNFSWGVTPDLARYFTGSRLGDLFVATSGMTTGKNEYFVREIRAGNFVVEPFRFEYFSDPVTLAGAVSKARLGRLSLPERKRIEAAEAAGATIRNVRIVPLPEPQIIQLPDRRYAFYNKATRAIICSPPTHAIYWEDDGDAVLTYKRNGNWYLRGVGGKPYFGREGITWSLIASRLNARYLPPGYILDSGAPAAFLRDGVHRDELFFVLGWSVTKQASMLLKRVINHTRNIQGKDFERLPYPFWVGSAAKGEIVRIVQALVDTAWSGRTISAEDEGIRRLEGLFAMEDRAESAA